MPKCKTLDRVELTRKKFAKNLFGEITKKEPDNDWDGIHCPQCGKELRHVEGCLSCECGYFKC